MAMIHRLWGIVKYDGDHDGWSMRKMKKWWCEVVVKNAMVKRYKVHVGIIMLWALFTLFYLGLDKEVRRETLCVYQWEWGAKGDTHLEGHNAECIESVDWSEKWMADLEVDFLGWKILLFVSVVSVRVENENSIEWWLWIGSNKVPLHHLNFAPKSDHCLRWLVNCSF